MIATYTGNLIAFMTATKFTFPVDSLEELAASPDYQAGLMVGSNIESLFSVRFCLIFFLFLIFRNRSMIPRSV